MPNALRRQGAADVGEQGAGRVVRLIQQNAVRGGEHGLLYHTLRHD
jgi:hypothetical protein